MRCSKCERLKSDFAHQPNKAGAGHPFQQGSEESAAQRVWTELSCIVACSSPSGDAELDQVRLAYEQRAALVQEAAALRRENAKLHAQVRGATAQLEAWLGIRKGGA
jgi:multidrug resistance efflux pump